jgi:hypothetical protein
MPSDNYKNPQEFYINYKSASILLGKYKLNDSELQIILEIRKGAKSGCELFTEIGEVSFCLYSGLLRGCLHQMALQLPLGSIITIPHIVLIDVNEQILQLIINDEIYCRAVDGGERSNDQNSTVFTVLGCSFFGNELRTRPYEFDDIDVALREIKEMVGKQKTINIRICPNCRFMDYYANTMICLRDLSPSEFTEVCEMRKKREMINDYYSKIAWDIDNFHYCSAFSTNE